MTRSPLWTSTGVCDVAGAQRLARTQGAARRLADERAAVEHGIAAETLARACIVSMSAAAMMSPGAMAWLSTGRSTMRTSRPVTR